MKNISACLNNYLSILLLAICLSGCGSHIMDVNMSLSVQKNNQRTEVNGNVYRTEQRTGTQPAFYPIVYEDDRLKTEFQLSDIKFNILTTNKTAHPLVMLWSEATIASDENKQAVPLLTSPLVRREIFSERVNDRGRGFYRLNDQPMQPQLRRGISIKPDYSKLFSSWRLFSIAGRDTSIYSADAFKEKQLKLTVPVLDNNDRIEYEFTLTVIETKVRVSYY